MNDEKKKTPEELAEEISEEATVVNELGKSALLSKQQLKKIRGPLKRQLKQIKRDTRLLSKEMKTMKSCKSGRK